MRAESDYCAVKWTSASDSTEENYNFTLTGDLAPQDIDPTFGELQRLLPLTSFYLSITFIALSDVDDRLDTINTHLPFSSVSFLSLHYVSFCQTLNNKPKIKWSLF